MLFKLLRAFFRPDANRLTARALALRQQGDLRAAESLLRDAVKSFPRDAVCLMPYDRIDRQAFRVPEQLLEIGAI